MDGRKYSLADFSKAKFLTVIFTCNHCPTAQYYEERIKKIAEDYRDKGVALVAIMPNDPGSVRLDELGWTDLSDTFDEMKIRARDRAFNFPYLYDGESETAAHAYGPVATPHAFVFDASRKLQYAGAIDDSERVQSVQKQHLRDALDALLAGVAAQLHRCVPVLVDDGSPQWRPRPDVETIRLGRNRDTANQVKIDGSFPGATCCWSASSVRRKQVRVGVAGPGIRGVGTGGEVRQRDRVPRLDLPAGRARVPAAPGQGSG